ncbi:MAG: hypothetical protein VB091_14435, partial [Christensenella sp.]|nr:hypothetical protein [Christensenella sp.]
ILALLIPVPSVKSLAQIVFPYKNLLSLYPTIGGPFLSMSVFWGSVQKAPSFLIISQLLST